MLPQVGATPLGGGGLMRGGSDVAGEALAAALGAVRGNEACADCGGRGPEWASLNLGVLLCASCAGVHRHMGVHISKVRGGPAGTVPLPLHTPRPAPITVVRGVTSALQLYLGNLPAR